MNNIVHKTFAEVDLRDSFFQSLRDDYPGFDEWFKGKFNQDAFVQYKNQKIVGFLYLKIEEEIVTDVNPNICANKILKVGTFKIDAHGTKMGEQFKREFAMDGKKYFENLYLYLTDACNMNCKHCYLGERLVEKEQMPLSSVKAHLDFWREVGSTKVCFLGGDPTLYEHLHESVDYARALNYNKVIINTNLTNYAYKIMKEFTPEEITYIQTSLDGATSTTHDTIRRPGAFSETTESISK